MPVTDTSGWLVSAMKLMEPSPGGSRVTARVRTALDVVAGLRDALADAHPDAPKVLRAGDVLLRYDRSLTVGTSLHLMRDGVDLGRLTVSDDGPDSWSRPIHKTTAEGVTAHVRSILSWLPEAFTAAIAVADPDDALALQEADEARRSLLRRIGMTACAITGIDAARLQVFGPAPWEPLAILDAMGEPLFLNEEAHAFVAHSIPVCLRVSDEGGAGSNRFDIVFRSLNQWIDTIDMGVVLRTIGERAAECDHDSGGRDATGRCGDAATGKASTRNG